MYYCPHCKSKKPLVKAGRLKSWGGYNKQRYQCKNKKCRRFTVNPRKELD